MKIIPASVPKIECFEVLEVKEQRSEKIAKKMIIKRLVGIIWNNYRKCHIKLNFYQKGQLFISAVLRSSRTPWL